MRISGIHRSGGIAVATLLAATSLLPAPGATAAPVDATVSPGISTTTPDVTTDQATGYHIDARHNGTVAGDQLEAPLKQKWSVDFGADIGYSLIANGRVFVLVSSSSSPAHNKLSALDEGTGLTLWGPVDVGDAFGTTYDQGRVFTMGGSDTVRAFDAVTGAPGWAEHLAQQFFSNSAPQAFGGTLYVAGEGNAGTLFSINESNGNVNWSQQVPAGVAVTVGPDGVYASEGCSYFAKFTLSTGGPLWTHLSDPSCGQIVNSAALYKGRLYLPQPNGSVVVDANTGLEVGTDHGRYVPTFAGNSGFFLGPTTPQATPDVLESRDLGTGAIRWTFSGDGQLNTAPVAVNGVIYTASASGMVYGLDETTGGIVWSVNAGSPIIATPDQGSAIGGPVIPALAAGEGVLAVPASGHLVLYDSLAPTIAGAVGGDNALWVHDASGYRSLGGVLAGSPAVVSIQQPVGGNRTYYIVVGHDGNLWVRGDANNEGWRPLDDQPVICRNGPAAGTVGSTLYVGCRAGDDALWYGSADISTGGVPHVVRHSWSSLGGVLIDGPAIAPETGGPLFMALGSDNRIYLNSRNGYSATNWGCQGHPAASVAGTTTYFACNGGDSQLWYSTRVNGGSWSAATPLGGRLIDGPGLASTPAGARFFVEGGDQGLYETALINGTQTGWRQDGGIIRLEVGATTK